MKRNWILFFCLIGWACSKESEFDPPGMEDDTFQMPTSTLNYDDLASWAYHPNKISLLSSYELDIAVIDRNIKVEDTISITNNAYKDTGVDVFFVHPTILTQNEKPENILLEDQSKFLIEATILAQGGLLAKYGRFYAPRYRQSTGITYRNTIDKRQQAEVVATSYSDIKSAFLHYLEHENKGNKFILAGHSQGAFLLAFLLKDVIDQDENIRNRMVAAALGGMGYVYAASGQDKGGWWQNIGLCDSVEEGGCIINWACFDEAQELPSVNDGFPQFNPFLIESGLVYRPFDPEGDVVLQDLSYYGSHFQTLSYYITPAAQYSYGDDFHFLAFSDMYEVRQRREGPHQVGLSIRYRPQSQDQRPNELTVQKLHPNYENWGYHIKDYHIYLWALINQLDAKLE